MPELDQNETASMGNVLFLAQFLHILETYWVNKSIDQMKLNSQFHLYILFMIFSLMW